MTGTRQSVCVSYARNVNKNNKLVEKIIQAAEGKFTVKWDESELTPGKSIKEFEQVIGRSEAVIVILSDEYYQSKYCMEELLLIDKHLDFKQRVFAIVTEATSLDNDIVQVKRAKWWKQQHNELKEELKGETDTAMAPHQEVLDCYERIYENISRLQKMFSEDICYLEADLVKNDFKPLVSAVHTRLQSLNSPDSSPVTQQKDYTISKTSFQEKVKEKIQKELKQPSMQSLAKEISSLAPGAEPATSLCTGKFLQAVDLLQSAAEKCLDQYAERASSDDIVNRFKKHALEILGWQILLAIDEEWITDSSGINDIFDDQKITGIEIPFRTSVGAEVAIARIGEKKPARFVKNHTQVQGEGALDLGEAGLRSGFGEKGIVEEILRAFWLMIEGREYDKEVFKEEDKKRLNERLKTRNRRGKKHHFLTVPASQTADPLRTEAGKEELKKQLPDLIVLFFQNNSEVKVLILDDESELEVLILEFIEMIEEYS